jgi:hypothetical protein
MTKGTSKVRAAGTLSRVTVAVLPSQNPFMDAFSNKQPSLGTIQAANPLFSF